MKKILLTIVANILVIPSYCIEGAAEVIFKLTLYALTIAAFWVVVFIHTKVQNLRNKRIQDGLEWEQEKKMRQQIARVEMSLKKQNWILN